MSEAVTSLNELRAARAFDKQSALFDELYGRDAIIAYKRKRVRDHVARFLNPFSNILELNSGTGEDATYFAGQGHHVHATDISSGMLNRLNEKTRLYSLSDRITSEPCSFNQLAGLKNKGPFDLIFSNFAGLNCTGELDKVLDSFDSLLKPGGIVTLVLLPEFCLWETLLLFKGRFKTAFRRFFSRKGRKAHVEGEYFKCWYYNPSYITKRMKDRYDVLSIEGLCIFVPPSYIEHFAEKHPHHFSWLRKKEDKLKSAWPWRAMGDYYVISLRKKA